MVDFRRPLSALRRLYERLPEAGADILRQTRDTGNEHFIYGDASQAAPAVEGGPNWAQPSEEYWNERMRRSLNPTMPRQDRWTAHTHPSGSPWPSTPAYSAHADANDIEFSMAHHDPRESHVVFGARDDDTRWPGTPPVSDAVRDYLDGTYSAFRFDRGAPSSQWWPRAGARVRQFLDPSNNTVAADVLGVRPQDMRSRDWRRMNLDPNMMDEELGLGALSPPLVTMRAARDPRVMGGEFYGNIPYPVMLEDTRTMRQGRPYRRVDDALEELYGEATAGGVFDFAKGGKVGKNRGILRRTRS